MRSKQERRQVVEETLRPGASVAVIARRHGVNANQLFHWRKLYREGRLDVAPPAAELVPVQIAEVMSGEPMPATLLQLDNRSNIVQLRFNTTLAAGPRCRSAAMTGSATDTMARSR